MDHETPRGKRSSRKRKATPAEKGKGTSIWDENFPFGVFIDKHFITEKNREEYEEWGLEKCFRILQATPIQLVSIARWMEQKVDDLEKSCKRQIDENTKLLNNFSESEKNVWELKRKLEELSLEKRGYVEREVDLIDKISMIEARLRTKEDIFNKLNAENEELKAENKQLKAKAEELKDEISKQHNAGFNEAVKQFLTKLDDLNLECLPG